MNISLTKGCLWGIGIFVLGSLSVFLLKGGSAISCEPSTYNFVNPRIVCLHSEEAYRNIQRREDAIRTYIEQAEATNKISRASVYFRDLEILKWFGVNQYEMYSPGSLLKLPLAIAYYKLAEVDPGVLSQPILYASSTLNDLEHFKAKSPLIAGNTYIVRELIEKMIVDSDNTVVPLLVNNLNQNFYNKVLLDLNIKIPSPEDGGINADFFSVVTYSSIFRGLYNSSYLQAQYAEEILSFLAKSTFKEGLVKGAPPGTQIAHKFGEVDAVDQVTKKSVKVELHDCGIFYKKDNHYILCISTEGKDLGVLSQVIADISRIVWND